MQYSNSIEGYCTKPISAEDIRAAKEALSLGKTQLTAFLWKYTFCIVVLQVFVFLAGLLGAPTLLVGMMTFILLAFGTMLGLCHAQDCAAIKRIKIVVHGLDMASYEGCLDEVDAPLADTIGSPLAAKLIKSIADSDRKMVRFEKDLVNLLTAI